MYNIRPTTKFQKDLKRVKKRGFDISLLTDIIKKLAAGEPLPEKNRDHQLSGDYAGCRECHLLLPHKSENSLSDMDNRTFLEESQNPAFHPLFFRDKL